MMIQNAMIETLRVMTGQQKSTKAKHLVTISSYFIEAP